MPSFYERSCDNCRKLKIRCDRVKPSCKNCSKRGSSCTRNKPLQKRGPKPKQDTSDKSKSRKKSHKSGEQSHQLNNHTSNSLKEFSKSKYAEFSSEELSEGSDYGMTESEGDVSHLSTLFSDEIVPDTLEGILSSELDDIHSNHELVSSLSDDSFENPSTPENHRDDYFPDKPAVITSTNPEPFPLQEVLFFSGGISVACPTYGYTDSDSRIDTPFTVKTTIQNDLVRFEKSLTKAVPDQITKQQADYLVYYFTHIQPLLPLVSQHRFLNLISYQDSPEPSNVTDSPENSFQSTFKTLVSALCQVSYLFALNPNLFQHSILTFLAQTNLDILFSGEASPGKLPAILTNALVMLIRYHLSATAI